MEAWDHLRFLLFVMDYFNLFPKGSVTQRACTTSVVRAPVPVCAIRDPLQGSTKALIEVLSGFRRESRFHMVLRCFMGLYRAV